MAQSAELTKFYNAYNNWLEAGAPHRAPFTREYGLCANVYKWTDWDVSAPRPVAQKCDLAASLIDQMEEQFHAANLSGAWPFGGSSLYVTERRDNTQHENQQRIAWVKAHLVA